MDEKNQLLLYAEPETPPQNNLYQSNRPSRKKKCVVISLVILAFLLISARRIYSVGRDRSVPSLLSKGHFLDEAEHCSHEPSHQTSDTGNSYASPAPNDTVSILSNLQDEWESWPAGHKFCNVIGSAGDKPLAPGLEAESWLAAWIERVEIKKPDCQVKGCKEKATVGGHVVEIGEPLSPAFKADDVVRVIPLCSDHNGAGYNEQVLEAEEEVSVLVLDCYCCDSEGSNLCKPGNSVKGNCRE